MNVSGRPMRTIWPTAVEIIDQTRLPHAFATARLGTLDEAAHAIRAMLVRRCATHRRHCRVGFMARAAHRCL